MFGPVTTDKGNTVMMWVVYPARLSAKRVRKGKEGMMGWEKAADADIIA